MKLFEAPKIEVVHFEMKDVILTSLCYCIECPECQIGFDCKRIEE